MRIGAKKRPFYRVVVVDERVKRTGGYIELLGTYNPLTEPKDIKLKTDRIDYWIKQGAKMSNGYLRIIGKAPQRPPRKPKKEKKTEAPAEEAKTEVTTPEEAKSEIDKATSAVESAPAEGTPEDSLSQQTGSEAKETISEPEITEPSGALQSDEPTKPEESEKKDEGSA